MGTALVDYEQCDKLVDLMSSFTIPLDQEEVLEIRLEDDVIKNFYFTIVAICHQTSPRDGIPLEGMVNGVLRKGWDYLREKWLEATMADPSMVYPERLALITSNHIEEILRDNGISKVSDSKGRALLLNDIGQTMLKLGLSTIQDLFNRCEGNLVSADGTGILASLSKFKAYSDPVMKKSLYFIALMKNHHFWIINDEFNLGPPVDYHEIRGHLRIGTVMLGPELWEKIIGHLDITNEQDVMIRRCVFDAIMYIAKQTGYSPSTLHYFFWNIFRNCCNRDYPHCDICTSCTTPHRYKELSQKPNCLFGAICKNTNKPYILEPNVVTDFY